MKKKLVKIYLIIFLTLTLAVTLNVRPARASGTIYIRSDGSVDPPTAPIERVGSMYTFTADIYESIVIQKDYVTVDGNGHLLQGSGSGNGFEVLSLIRGVSILNTTVSGFGTGVYVLMSDSDHFEGNSLTGNGVGIEIIDSSGCSVLGNSFSNNGNAAIQLYSAVQYTTIDGNSIQNNGIGLSMVAIFETSRNTIVHNLIAYNDYGVSFNSAGGLAGDNVLYHNSFIGNVQQVFIIGPMPGMYPPNSWDNGYPSGGNYWADYTDIDQYSGPNQNETGSDGIWDHPYTIVTGNVDHYPFTQQSGWENVLTISATAGGTTNPPPGSHVYDVGSVVTVTALPEVDYLFDHWALDDVNIGSANPVSLTMDANHVLQASFRLIPDIAVVAVTPYPLNVRRGEPVYVDVDVENQYGSAETFDVVVYADKDRKVIGDEVVVGTQTVDNLVPGTRVTLNFVWDTSALQSGYYISAKAVVTYDRDLSDNLLTAKKKVVVRS